ncbi:hypothetical protein C0992_003154, partial [Termitomyces sp. T32_za158]
PPIVQPSLPQEAPTPLVATHAQRETEAPPTVHAGIPTPDCSHLAEEPVWTKNGSDPLIGNPTAPPPSNAEWDSILVDSPPLSPVELSLIGEEFSTQESCQLASTPHPATLLTLSPMVIAPSSVSPGQRREGGTPQSHGPPRFREVTEDNITTNSRGLRRTAAPNGGWPKVHLLSTPWENVADSQAEAWSLVTSPKLWARVFRGKYEPNSLEIVDKTREIIKKLIPIDGEISWGVSFPPQKCRIDTDRFPTPYHMLISGIPADQVDYISSLEVISTEEITILLKPFENQRPEFITTICGLTFHNSPESAPVVLDLVTNRFRSSKVIVLHVTENSSLAQDKAVAEIMDNLSVKFIEVKRSAANGGNFRGWNVYLHKSSLCDADHIQLIQLMRTCDFPTATFGYGVPLKGKDTLSCVGCKSIDHDSPNCPFPGIPGWLGYKPQVQAAQVTTGTYPDVMENRGGTPAQRRGGGRGRGYGGRGRSGHRRGGRGF